MNEKIRASINSAPKNPGVYLWKDEEGKILYVGKADNLRNRLGNYLSPKDIKTIQLVERSDSIETIITKTATEALILEDALVKQNQPRYNVRLRDDKRHPYIKVTVKEESPRIEVVRKVEPDGSRYFGPYADPDAVRRVVKVIQELFGLRMCRHDLKKLKRPCLNYSMGICTAPCFVASKREYADSVGLACGFLSGKYGGVKKDLRWKIKEQSKKMQYEKAAKLKETLDAIESLSTPQDVSSAALEDMDVLGYARVSRNANITQLKVRGKKVVAVLHHLLKGEYSGDPAQSMGAFIKQHYTTKDLTPKKIYVSVYPEDVELLEKALHETLRISVSIRQAHRGQKKKLVDIAVQNSFHQLSQKKGDKKTSERLLALKKELGLSRIPSRIEGYDISNLGGKHTVGGMAVFTNGAPDKGQYRRFRIKRMGGQDDPGSMAEMLSRRFRHDEWVAPDVVLLDGGITQLNACIKHIPQGIAVVALAKKQEEIYLLGKTRPLQLAKNNPAILLLQAVRNESHRFGHAYHLKKRSKGFI